VSSRRAPVVFADEEAFVDCSFSGCGGHGMSKLASTSCITCTGRIETELPREYWLRNVYPADVATNSSGTSHRSGRRLARYRSHRKRYDAVALL